jgi:hypothetical protein
MTSLSPHPENRHVDPEAGAVGLLSWALMRTRESGLHQCFRKQLQKFALISLPESATRGLEQIKSAAELHA